MRRVVVTGIGAVTPVGNSAAEFADAIFSGRNGIGTITRFDIADSKCKVAAEVRDFDPAKRLDKTTIRKTDLFTQYALYAADEAMEDSGIAGTVDECRFGVIIGSGVGGIGTLTAEEDALAAGGQRKVSPQFVPKMIINIAAGQAAIRYHAHGAVSAVVTACASGTDAVGEAFRRIRDGYSDAMICGGTEAAVNPLTVAGFVNCMALTQSEDPGAASLPFDARRGGFVLGEGAAILILEEYEHAAARGAKIYCEITGYGATCDAYHVTAPAPDTTYVARAITDAAAGLDVPADQLYVNAHGTGTPMNDVGETAAFKQAFGDDAYKLHISSTKSMTGHMLGAAGAIEAIACVLALQNDTVPPTINLLTPDEKCDLNYTPGTAVKTPLAGAISTSLGFGGHNACLAFKKI
ncbi:MAG: beta-ketoacyl-[acyl-carrier-protein] synthase II [Ruminococcaceae bacterium]|nr:beta-ketoacyl-[acyl-carrier-protein] synthase II [Oscillospiraceae bacterium]